MKATEELGGKTEKKKPQCLASRTQKKTLVWSNSGVQKRASLELELLKHILLTCTYYWSDTKVVPSRWEQLLHLDMS